MGKSIYFTKKELSWLYPVVDDVDNRVNDSSVDTTEEDKIQESVVFKILKALKSD